MRLGLLLLALSIAMGSGCRGKAERAAILIGHIEPSSRLDPTAGEQSRRGVLLAVEEFHHSGDLISGRRVKVLHPEPLSDPEAVKAAAVRLTSIDKVTALIGGTDSTQAEALAQVAEAARIPLIIPAGAPTRRGNGFVFHTAVSPIYRGELLGRFAAAQFPEHGAAVMVNIREGLAGYTEAIAGTFTREYRKAGGRILGEWTFQTANESLELLKRFADDTPEVLVICGTADDVLQIRNSVLSAKNRPLIVGAAESTLATMRAHVVKNPIFAVTSFLPTEPQARDFVRKYEQRWGQPPGVHAALAYDSARLLFDALKKAGEAEHVKLRDALAEIKHFTSVTGPMTWDAAGWPKRTMYIVRVEDGQMATVTTFDPPAQ